MNILSIDVGMRHLAFCILHQQNNGNYSILEWDIVDLCASDNNICHALRQNKKVCGKPAKYYKDTAYYCRLHAKKQKYAVPSPDMKLSQIKKMKITALKALAKKNDYSISKGSKKADYINYIIADLSNNYLNPIINTNSKTINCVTFGRRIKLEFDLLLAKTNIDCMIIENQIGPLALRMKMVQGMIMQHFIEIGCECIKEISPANKLKDFISNKKTSYAERKKIGIEVTRKLINENNNISGWKEHFEKHKKKDDLADSFLQGLWYIKQ